MRKDDMRGKTLLGLGLAWLAAIPGAASGHPFDIGLMDADGNPIVARSATPYSPKQTCGRCHTYESDPTIVSKQQTVGGVANAPYDVRVPAHGASAGFHFQQGMNAAWGDTQRTFYRVPSFTSSPGMVGKY
jgi:hypothetical protein